MLARLKSKRHPLLVVSPGSLPALLLLGLLVYAGNSCQTPANEPPVKADPAAPAVNLEKLTVDELIDRLQGEGGDWFGPVEREITGDFLGLRLGLPPEGGGFCSGKAEKAPVLWEIVRRGLSSLPKLLDHLEDRRPTKWVITVKSTSRVWRTNRSVQREIRGRSFVSMATDGIGIAPYPSLANENRRVKEDWHYTLKVGELCYVAVGQIVNRDLTPADLDGDDWVIFRSPVLMPQLAKACREEWGGLTREKHRQLLTEDCFNPWRCRDPLQAMTRLYLYYPREGEKTILDYLKKPDREPVSLTGFLKANRLSITDQEEQRITSFIATVEDFSNRSSEFVEFLAEYKIVKDQEGKALLLAGRGLKMFLIEMASRQFLTIPTEKEIAAAIKECEKQHGKKIASLIPAEILILSMIPRETDYFEQAVKYKAIQVLKTDIFNVNPNKYRIERISKRGSGDFALSLPDFRNKNIDLKILEILKQIPGFGPTSTSDLQLARSCTRKLAGRLGEPELRRYLEQRIEQAKKDPAPNAFGYDLPIYTELLNSLKKEVP